LTNDVEQHTPEARARRLSRIVPGYALRAASGEVSEWRR
jgi:hypothetical protein